MAWVTFFRSQRNRKYIKVINQKKRFFVKNISKNKFDIYSGPLHIVSFIPNKLEPEDSDKWTQTKVNELFNNNFMLSRPKFKGRYFLRVVMGNYNTKAVSYTHLKLPTKRIV